jgi:fatty-acyl-CoA synthase
MKPGNTVPVGERGEICVRGYSVMLGYWDDEQRTAETIDGEGWLHSGDIGIMDEEGYVQVVGRIKDMIIRGGENVYPREVEEFLYTHPAILEAQVFGIPHGKYGEEVCAWIQLQEGQELSEEELRDFCRDRITHFKIPSQIRFVGEFPMTVTGKIQKFLMRDAMAEEPGPLPPRQGSASLQVWIATRKPLSACMTPCPSNRGCPWTSWRNYAAMRRSSG